MAPGNPIPIPVSISVACRVRVSIRPCAARPSDRSRAEGWLGSFLTPDEAGRARETIQAAAAETGRELEADHFGIAVFLAEDGLLAERTAAIQARRPDVDPNDLVATSWPDLHRLLDGYLEAGLTKFVVNSSGTRPYDEFIDQFASELIPRQN
jgi:alkanesulfonate monooxygenase SsuD/methylene tetrahydromethanopterin reductase-like flavin-dependent oxidoreductase (luciferase family)